LLRDSVESLNTWREGRAYVRGRWEEEPPHHDQYRHEAPINLPAPKFRRPDTNTQRLTLAFGSMPSLSSGNRIPVEGATTRVPLIIDRSKSQTGAADFNSYITRQLQGRLDPRVSLDVYHHRSMENLGLQATDLFAWGTFRKHERNDTAWFDVFQSKVRYDSRY